MKVKKSFYEKKIKRIQDIILSVLACIVLSPLLLIVAILVRIKIGKPILFTQYRVGQNDKIFKLYKFRTMTDRRDDNGKLLPDYERLTKFGATLRATSLDELPELWNVIRGDMSIIGPRPLLIEYLELYSSEQRRRHEVKPGLSGYAQINGRNLISWEEKFRLDVEYVDNISFKKDWMIIFKTIGMVLKRQGISSSTSVTMEPFKGSKIQT